MTNLNKKSLFAIAIYFGETQEFVSDKICGQFVFTELLDCAVKFKDRIEAEQMISDLIEFGKASAWVNVNYKIFEFEA